MWDMLSLLWGGRIASRFWVVAVHRRSGYFLRMLLITANKPQRLLCLHYVQRVSPAELAAAYDELKAVLAELPGNFRLLADLSQVEFMEPECMTELGRAMDLIDQHGVKLIVRVIPDPAKDMGLNILAIFHYPDHPKTITCDSLADALRQLARWK